MKKQLISYPHMLLIGSSSRNIGKTHLATSLIRRNRQFTDIIGLKVTTIKEKTKTCPHGNENCCICSEIEGNYLISEEKDGSLEKDTSLLLNAGAKKVYWLIVLEDKLDEGARALLNIVPPESVIVAESNRFRRAVQPGFFLMLINPQKRIKESAKSVQQFADLIIEADGKRFDYDIDKIEYSQDKWQILRV
ncbi:MAG: hypothetical protein MUP98_02535 [Candidatus Aminicenantes bacterium]|nr:hypothetical protein [Candidatus Aminicenantes bacterium]